MRSIGCWKQAVVVTALMMMAGSSVAEAGKADVVGVSVRKTAPGTFSFDVTVRHDDQGWQHYADRWDVVAPDGTVLASRELAHPHDQEQPFTRSLAGVAIAAGIGTVRVRAHDGRHGLGGKEVSVAVPH